MDITEELTRINEEDINMKMQIVRNVDQACFAELENKTLFHRLDKIEDRFQKYVGLKEDTCKSVMSKLTKNIEHAHIHERNKVKIKLADATENHELRTVILHRIRNQILENKNLTSLNTISAYITEYQRDHTKETIREQLCRLGFKWQLLPHTEYSFIVEKNRYIKERHNYLKKMKQYRSDKRNIVYINNETTTSVLCDERVDQIAIQTRVHRSIKMAVSPSCGMKKFVEYQSESDFQRWILNAVIPILPPNSVLLFEEPLKHNRRPKKDSLKKEMERWLSDNHVPFAPNMHKAELYELIQKFKDNCDRNRGFYENIEVLGHTAMHVPYGMADLKYFDPFWKSLKESDSFPFLNEDLDFTEALRTFDWFTNECDADYWMNLDLAIVSKETKYMSDDVKIEDIIDSIMIYAAHGKLLSIDISLLDLDTNIPDDNESDSD